MVLVSHPGIKRIPKSTGLFVRRKHWNSEAQIVTRGCPYMTVLNTELEQIKSRIIELPTLYRAKGKPLTRQTIMEEVERILQKADKPTDFFTLAEKVEISKGMQKIHNAMIRQVKEYTAVNGQSSLSVNDLSYQWFKGLYTYSTIDRGSFRLPDELQTNRIKPISRFTYGGYLARLKFVLSEIEKMGYLDCTDYKKVDTISNVNPDTSFIYLNEEKIQHLYRFQYSRPEYRDAIITFAFMCGTAVRISDVHHYKIVDQDLIEVNVQKTEKGMLIPYSYNPMLCEILQKCGDNLPQIPYSAYNDLLQAACKEAGLKEWEQVFAHTGRRSFATNMYLRNWPVQMIMQITGHTKEATFYRYIRMKKREKADFVLDHAKKDYAAQWEAIQDKLAS